MARALAGGDAARVCDNLAPYFKRFLTGFLLRAVRPGFVPRLPAGASLQQRCEAAITGDLADPYGDDQGLARLRPGPHAVVVFSRDRGHATVCLGPFHRSSRPAVRIHGRWLLSDLPSDGLSERQFRICGPAGPKRYRDSAGIRPQPATRCIDHVKQCLIWETTRVPRGLPSC